jgi:hypothetical protein
MDPQHGFAVYSEDSMLPVMVTYIGELQLLGVDFCIFDARSRCYTRIVNAGELGYSSTSSEESFFDDKRKRLLVFSKLISPRIWI